MRARHLVCILSCGCALQPCWPAVICRQQRAHGSVVDARRSAPFTCSGPPYFLGLVLTTVPDTLSEVLSLVLGISEAGARSLLFGMLRHQHGSVHLRPGALVACATPASKGRVG